MNCVFCSCGAFLQESMASSSLASDLIETEVVHLSGLEPLEVETSIFCLLSANGHGYVGHTFV